MRILRSNFETALAIAITNLQRSEAERYGTEFESTFVSGLKQVLEASKKGEQITVSDR